jgi:hydrogenase maturation protease
MSADRAPILVIAVGNPSRGDDALGPMLAERLEAWAAPDVEVLTDFQLQVEHALDLAGRELVIFIDAGVATWAPYEVRSVEPDGSPTHTSHALSPETVLAVCARLVDTPLPVALLLCVRGESFGLGEPLSAAGRRHVEAAWPELQHLCQSRAIRRNMASRRSAAEHAGM